MKAVNNALNVNVFIRQSYSGWTSVFGSEQDEHPAVSPETSRRTETLSDRRHLSTERQRHNHTWVTITLAVCVFTPASGSGPGWRAEALDSGRPASSEAEMKHKHTFQSHRCHGPQNMIVLEQKPLKWQSFYTFPASQSCKLLQWWTGDDSKYDFCVPIICSNSSRKKNTNFQKRKKIWRDWLK